MAIDSNDIDSALTIRSVVRDKTGNYINTAPQNTTKNGDIDIYNQNVPDDSTLISFRISNKLFSDSNDKTGYAFQNPAICIIELPSTETQCDPSKPILTGFEVLRANKKKLYLKVPAPDQASYKEYKYNLFLQNYIKNGPSEQVIIDPKIKNGGVVLTEPGSPAAGSVSTDKGQPVAKAAAGGFDALTLVLLTLLVFAGGGILGWALGRGARPI